MAAGPERIPCHGGSWVFLGETEPCHLATSESGQALARFAARSLWAKGAWCATRWWATRWCATRWFTHGGVPQNAKCEGTAKDHPQERSATRTPGPKIANVGHRASYPAQDRKERTNVLQGPRHHRPNPMLIAASRADRQGSGRRKVAHRGSRSFGAVSPWKHAFVVRS
jgi:hypothetical protein